MTHGWPLSQSATWRDDEPVADYALTLSDVEVARYQGMAKMAMATETATFVSAGIVPGAVVADVGCGPGALSVELARMVGPDGSVLAVDRDPAARAVAARLVAEAGLGNVIVSEGDATASGIAADSVDVAMMRHVLAHNGGQEQQIVHHLASLVRPGGAVYLVDVDATAVRARPPSVLDQLQERYLQFHAGKGNDLSVGLRLAELLTAAGLDVTTYLGRYQILSMQPGMRPPSWAARDEMVAAGVIDRDDIARWERELARLEQTGPLPTLFIPQFLAVGRRPA